MTVAAPAIETSAQTVEQRPSAWSMAMRSGRVRWGGGLLLAIIIACIATMPWTLRGDPGVYELQDGALVRQPPKVWPPKAWFGYDPLGRSIFARCMLGGTISLAVGVAAAMISVVLGVSVGLIAGFRGGWIDSLLMRSVDVLYGLPYILLVILLKIAFEDRISQAFNSAQVANMVVLFSAIGLVSWLTMARVVRGQVLSIRAMPYIEACRAMGLPQWSIFIRHILPNLIGVVIVYATLTVPVAILQESFLSFLGVGINPPLPTWGSLASDGVGALSPIKLYWWMLLFPCILLVVTLLSLNFVGDGLRDVFDPKREAAKI
ncbi:MAG TPA: ABC transporter permease [Tepidisphaeraceae bacterium]|jgi:oligopeptide transport system permease protein|nr:ABC transporter permease [Tepidisphaeraceae bacterium]